MLTDARRPRDVAGDLPSAAARSPAVRRTPPQRCSADDDVRRAAAQKSEEHSRSLARLCDWRDRDRKRLARTVRAQKALGFLEVNDGSSFGGLQVVFEGDLVQSLKGVGTGCAVSIEGEVVKGGGKQPIELKASSFELVGGCEGDYPLQKKRHSLEFLRSIAHLRPRTNTLAAAARIRSTLAQAVHAFFDEEGFNYVHSPIITTSDCEGAGEMFRVTSLDGKELSGSAEKNDFADDFFARRAYLTVSGQLSGEAYACALGDVYTFGPTFRAENSQTARHLAEFWMIEPEIAFADASGAMDNAEAMMKFVIKKALSDCRKDLEFCDKFYGNNELIDRLTSISGSEPFLRLSYTCLLYTSDAADE